MAVKTVEDIRWRLSVGRGGLDYVIGNVHHFRGLNYRKDYGTENDKKKTRDALSRYGGWDPQYPINGEQPTPVQIAIALHEREAQRTYLNNMASGTSGEDQQMYKAMVEIFDHPAAGFVDAEGKLLPPIDIGITGNRRSSEYLWSMGSVLLDVARTQGDVSNLHLTIPVMVPTNVTEVVQTIVGTEEHPVKWVFGEAGTAEEGHAFPADKGGERLTISPEGKVVGPDGKTVKGYKVENKTLNRFPGDAFHQKLRREVQIRENSTKTDGFKEPSDAEKLESVADLVKNGAIQNDVRKHYGSVLGLRLFFACICARYEVLKKFALKLFDRWTAAPYLDTEGKPTYEKSYSTGQGQSKETHQNRENPNYLPFGDFNQAAFQGLNSDKTPPSLQKYPMGRMCDIALSLQPDKALAEINKPRLEKGEISFQLPTKLLMEEWIDEVVRGNTDTVRPMKGPAMGTWAGRSASNAIKQTILSVMNDNTAYADELEKRADGTNALLIVTEPAYQKLAGAIDVLSNLTEEQQLEYATQIAELMSKVTATTEAAAPAVEAAK